MVNSSFPGDIEEIPCISVDNFERSTQKENKWSTKRAYFLSHAHRDHTVGLYDHNEIFATYLLQNNASIYMSEDTAKIFNYEYRGLDEFVKPMKFGERQLISLPATKDKEDEHFYVTLIPAGHCLGSAMILFQTNRKTILYTGDFRYRQNDVKLIRDLHDPNDRSQPIQIDTMYLDTTFQTLDKEDLPKRSDSVQYLLREVEAWLKKGPHYKVALDTSATYGYEYVFNEIFEKLKRKVHVIKSQWILYSDIRTVQPSVTNDIDDVDVHLCTWGSQDHRKCEIGAETIEKSTFLTVRLSAYKWQNYELEHIPISKQNNCISVCFSTHCSRSELLYFVNHFCPKKVVGFPKEFIRNMTPKKIEKTVVLSPIKRRRIKF